MHACQRSAAVAGAGVGHPRVGRYIYTAQPTEGLNYPVNHNTVFTIPYAQYSPHTAYTAPTAR